MKTAKVLLALSISACAAAAAEACSSSPPNAVFTGASSSGSGSGAPTGGGTPAGRSPNTYTAPPFACGHSTSCKQPLSFCCVSVVEGGTGGGSGASTGGDAAAAARDAASLADAGAEAASDSGGGGASNDAGTSDASGANDAAMQVETGARTTEAGSGTTEAGGAGTSSQGAGEFEFHCSLNVSTCPGGTAIAFGCAGTESCSSGQSCCAEFVDGGFVAQCSPPPCASGKMLCVTSDECRTGEVCVPASDYGGSYNTCVAADGGANDGGLLDSASNVEGGGPRDGGSAD